MPTNPDPAAIGLEIETLIERLEALGDAPASADARELVRLLMSLYGAGLARILDIARTETGGPQAILDRFAADGLVASLMVLHDLHPHPLEVRVQQAVAALQPHLPPKMTLRVLAAAGSVVRLQIDAPPQSQSGAVNLRASVERAIQEAAPEIRDVHIEGADGLAAAPLIQITGRSGAAVKSRRA